MLHLPHPRTRLKIMSPYKPSLRKNSSTDNFSAAAKFQIVIPLDIVRSMYHFFAIYIHFFLKRCTSWTYQVVHFLPRTIVCTYGFYKEAPEDGPLRSETCRTDT